MGHVGINQDFCKKEEVLKSPHERGSLTQAFPCREEDLVKKIKNSFKVFW